MASLHDFKFTVRHAEFGPGKVPVPIGHKHEVYVEDFKRCTLVDAVRHLHRLSAREPRDHVATLSMRYPLDVKPKGFSKARTRIDKHN